MTPKNLQDVVDAYDDDAAVHRQVVESGKVAVCCDD